MAASGEFSIYVKTLTGANAEVRVSSDEQVGALKSKIQEKLKLSVPIVRLVYNSKELGDDGKTLNDYEVGKEAIVVVVLESSKPCHFFFALDESGSMSGRRWDELIRSFKDFVTTRHEDAAKKGEKLNDLVSVFFHETGCRVADYIDAAGNRRPFDSVPLADVTPDSLANEFRSGGNNFDRVLAFLEPFLYKCTDYIPVLMFMTDGGDCANRQDAYDRMAAIKKRLPELRLYVTVVYTTSHSDLEGGKQLCRAGGSDVETFFTHLEDEGAHFGGGYAMPAVTNSLSAPRSRSARPAAPAAAVAPSSAGSAQVKMARQWEHAYQCNSSYRPS